MSRHTSDDFAHRLVRWQAHAGRNDLPWQNTRDPYPIWVAEIMLQQTRVATAIPYYQRFMARFPDVATLACAPEDEVLRLWSGLGYYSRARNLQHAAREIVTRHAGRFPHALAEIGRLPGIGRSTAAAIAGFAFGARAAILDGNVKRVLARHFLIEGFPGEPAVERQLWALAESLVPERGVETYIQGLMDLGATLCTARRPACGRCPVRATCGAYAANRVTELPAPRPRKRVPVRGTVMLVLRHGTDVLLERRPATGVWGGLWSLPELTDAADVPAAGGPEADLAATVKRAVAQRYGFDARCAEPLAIVRHTFTHFTLEMRPVLVDVGRIDRRAGEPGVRWLPLGEACAAALPAPVKRLLLRLGGGASGDQPSLLEEAVQDL
ncbi:MAG: A/G-specific adenine glycosylase [Burkholderiales bacterium]|nr:A/G-specific adenine glycosylase [Burkholderiales bacterium]